MSSSALTAEHSGETVAVAFALRDLERRLADLAMALAHGGGLFSVDGATGDAARRIADAYTAIDLGLDDPRNRSVVCLGVGAVDRHVVQVAGAVNEAKGRFKAVCAPLQRIRARVPVGDGTVTRSLPLIRVILRHLQRSQLNLLAAYRRIPILSARPTSVVYTRARTRSVYRKAIGEVMTLIEHSERPGAEADRARLAALPRSEPHVALVREHYENVRANVCFEALDRRGRGRAQLAAELPILFAAGPSPALPAIRYPAPGGAAAAPRRERRSRLEALPFLTTLSVYRYARS